ncbi:MAG: murein L,D-transpeptidase, partial [Afipia sp.]|nr:murein L,D-transpeptidase [Afipia sp.]
MRDFSTGHRKSPAGFDRVLMAVAATFLSVAATTAYAQSGPAKSPADLAIDAAVPLPEPANVPPPTVNDFKPDTAAAATPPKKEEAAAPATAPATTATVPAAATAPTATAPTATPPAATAAAPAVESPKTEPAKAAPAVAAADQPVADKLRDLIAAKGARYFDRKNERTAVENFYKDRNYAPLWSEAGVATARAKSVIARLKDASSDGLNAADYPTPDFATATIPDAQAEAELRLTESMLDYARHAQSGRMHYSRVSADISYPEHPVDPVEVLINVSTA